MARDYSKYNVKGVGENLNKRQLVFEIVKDYVEKNNIKKLILGLSGGIDSAVVLYIASKVIKKQNITAIMIPSIYTSQASIEDAKKIILAMKDIKGIISFIPDIGTLDLSMPYVQSSSLKKMISDTESKKILWKKLKEIILK